MKDDDLEATCFCGRCTVIIRDGMKDLHKPEMVIDLINKACIIACGCKVVV